MRKHWDIIPHGSKSRPRGRYEARQEIIYTEALKAAAKEITAATGQRVSPPTIERTIVIKHEPTVRKHYRRLREINKSVNETIQQNEGW
jgi:hypothetical protein